MAIEGKLTIIRGYTRDQAVVLPKEGELTIGRDHRRDLPIMSRRVSRHHARITCHDGTFALTDLGSKRGTLVNEREITARTVLRNNDVIRIGDVRIRFELQDTKKRAAPPKPTTPIVIAPKPGVHKAAKRLAQKRLPRETVREEPFTEKELALVGQTVAGIKMIAALAKTRRALVYKGIQSSRNRVVAFKMLQASAVRDPKIAQWFVSGAERAGEIQHGECVRVLGGGREGGIVFLLMPFKENGNAQERFALATDEGLPAIKKALESIVHVSRALEFAQSQGILHLGLRPSKILYDENRRVKLIGVGFDNSPSAPGATMLPHIEAYLAPEQFGGSGKVSIATDVFALGATFYYMLTGQQPKRNRRHRIPSPKRANPLVPDSICRIIEKMLDTDPERRCKSYGQLLHDVRWALRGEAWPRA